jgi:hypothetical protein
VADLESRPAAVRTVPVTARLAAAGFGHGAAAALLCLLLAVTGQFIRLGRESQDRTGLLLTQLQDARAASQIR